MKAGMSGRKKDNTVDRQKDITFQGLFHNYIIVERTNETAESPSQMYIWVTTQH